MNILFVILVFVISASITRLIISRILLISLRKKLFDMPSECKVYKHAIPRSGDISLFPVILLFSYGIFALHILMGYDVSTLRAAYLLPECVFLVCRVTLLYLTGIVDDLVEACYRQKFVIQIICVSFFPLVDLWTSNFYGLFGLYALPTWIGMPLTVLLVVFVTSAISLIDGIDGLASDLNSIALLVFDFLFMQKELWACSMLTLATSGALVPFFHYNVFGDAERARKISMGDTGSLTLGYVLSFLTIKYNQYNPDITPYTGGTLVIAFSMLIAPVFDVIRVMMVRIRNGKSPFEPDKNHIHHKFLAMSFTSGRTMITILLISCTFSTVNILLVPMIDNTVMLLTDIAVWVRLNLWFDGVEDKKQK